MAWEKKDEDLAGDVKRKLGCYRLLEGYCSPFFFSTDLGDGVPAITETALPQTGRGSP